MKKFFVILAFILSLGILQASATTVYYQPTPFPLKKMDGTAMPQDLSKIHIHDGWLNNYYPSIMTFQRDDKLKIGGWGDVYRAYTNIDMVGLPVSPTNVTLWLRFYPSGSTVTPFQFCIPNSTWDTTVTWATQPTLLGCTGMLTAPSTDSWAGWYITSWYQNWQNGTWGKYGFMLNPQYNNNNFDFIRSSRYTGDGYRPLFQFDFTPPAGMPNFKMPLPGGATWLLTNEIGGYECTGQQPWPDTAHQGANYFSVDFSPANVKDGGGSYTGNIPIIAAAGGKVAFAGTDSNYPQNGYFVVVDHDGDGLVSTGYQTRYLHMQSNLAVTKGQVIQQGDLLGYMGGTGGYPVHLHFGIRYQDQGYSSTSQLTYAVIDGWIMKSFQTECAVNSNGVPTGWIRYYHSSNRAY